ncbi:MAG TPA: class I SAM-dependent methyltransferase [Roseiflexaceae bacterium]
MTTTHTIEPGAGLPDDELPGYWRMLHAYHRSRSAELRAMIATLPLAPGDRVLDVASGDGCHSVWLAERGAQVVGVDLSAAYLDHARRRAAATPQAGRICFEQGDANALAFADGMFDLVWCAQSFYSLPDPIATLREMVRVTRPGGHVAVLENDTLHHILLPWPAELELAVRQAQLRALAADHGGQRLDKFYIGRNLRGLLRQCGVGSCSVRTFAVERDAPLEHDEELFLQLYFADMRSGAWPYLDAPARAAFDKLFDPGSETYLLRQPDLHLTHLETLAVGRVSG